MKFRCPQCGHNKVNVAIWGSAETTDGQLEVVYINPDWKENVRCTKCDHEGVYTSYIIITE